MAKAILFKNYTEEDFTWAWGGDEYTFKAGQVTYLEDWKAKHFAKHLINRELHKMGRQVNDFMRESLLKKCLGEETADETEEKIKDLILNEKEAVKAGRRMEKEEKEEDKDDDKEDEKEEEFADLKEEPVEEEDKKVKRSKKSKK